MNEKELERRILTVLADYPKGVSPLTITSECFPYADSVVDNVREVNAAIHELAKAGKVQIDTVLDPYDPFHTGTKRVKLP